ncbi:MAG: type IV pilin protein [Micavibrio sp.]
MNGIDKNRQKNISPGFTLIEVAMVIIIMGIVTLPLLRLYEQYILKQRIQVTRDNIQTSSTQISFFFTNTLRYACPSDRALLPTDPNYGREFDSSCNPAAVGLSVGSCTAGNGLCLVAGTRDADGDGANDPVLIGGVPVRSLKEINQSVISDTSAFDGWKTQLTYAVTLSLTNNGTYKLYNGVIGAIDEFGQNTAGINNDGHYVILSHGPDAKGGFTAGGLQPSACGPVTAAKDNENCNNDAVFVQALGAYKSASPDFYDDFVYFTKSRSSTLWAYIFGTGDIYNLNTNNVGIKTATPTERLEVNGAITTDNNVKATQLCQKDGTDCFNLDVITTTNKIRCGTADQVMTGVSIGDEICQVPVFSGTTPNVDCSPGWVHGIKSNGDVICWP